MKSTVPSPWFSLDQQLVRPRPVDGVANQCVDDRSRLRAFGKQRAKKLRVRLTLLEDAESLEELRNAPGHFHGLSGDRAGQFAADLDGPYRLIFVPVLTKEQMAEQASGFVWSKITHVRIVEITDLP